MPRKKKVIEEVSPDAAATQETMTTDEVPAAKNAVIEESPNPTTESPYVTTADVIKTLKPDEVVTLRPITDPNTPLSKITVFDGVEDADDSLTYRIPEEDVILKGKEEFYDKPNAIDLMAWQPTEDEIFFTEKDGMIIASYLTRMFNVPEDRQLLQYIIAKKHYKERIPDLLQHINYFIAHYDHDHEYLVATLTIKNYIDRHPDMSQ